MPSVSMFTCRTARHSVHTATSTPSRALRRPGPGTLQPSSPSSPPAAWPSRGDGPPHLYWTVQPNVNVPAGTYEVVDSDPGTWAYNSDSGNRGFAWVFGSYGGGSYGPIGPSPAATPQVNPQQSFGGISVAGNWSSNDGTIGSLVITQSGSSVSMKYAHRNGRVIGQLQGNVFDGYWTQDMSGRFCMNRQYDSSYWGKMVLTFNGDSYTGKWGFCNDAPGSAFQGQRTGVGSAQWPIRASSHQR